MSSRPPPWEQSLRRFVVWWILLGAFWLLLPSQLSLPEIVAGILAAALGALLLTRALSVNLIHFSVRLAWLRHFARLPLQAVADTLVVLGASWRQLLGGKRVQGASERVPFEPGGDSPLPVLMHITGRAIRLADLDEGALDPTGRASGAQSKRIT